MRNQFALNRATSSRAPASGNRWLAPGIISIFTSHRISLRAASFRLMTTLSSPPTISSVGARTSGKAGPARSGRPTSPMNKVSPVRTLCGSSETSVSDTSTQMPSGVWPGVSSTRSLTWPINNSSPFLTARCGIVAFAWAPKIICAPERAASSR